MSKAKSRRGFTIVEVLIAVAILGVVSAGVMSLMDSIVTSQISQKYGNNSLNLAEEIRSTLGSPGACLASFGGFDTTRAPPGARVQAGNAKIYDNATPANLKYQIGTRDADGTAELTSMNFTDYKPIAGTNRFGQITLELGYKSVGQALNPYRKTSIFLQTQVDAANKIIYCVSLSKLTDSLWQIVPLTSYDIFFAQGKVGVGIAVPSSSLTVFTDSPMATTIESSPSIFKLTTGRNNQSLYMGYDGAGDAGFIEASKAGSIQPLILQPRGGLVGIGTTTPGANFEVSKFGSGVIVPDNPAIRVVNTNPAEAVWTAGALTFQNAASFQAIAGNGAIKGRFEAVYMSSVDTPNGFISVAAMTGNTPIEFITVHGASMLNGLPDYSEKARFTPHGALLIGKTKGAKFTRPMQPVGISDYSVNYTNLDVAGGASADYITSSIGDNGGLYFYDAVANATDARVYEGTAKNLNVVAGSGGFIKFLSQGGFLGQFDSTGSLTVSTNITGGGNLNITNNATIGGSLTVSGGESIGGDLTVRNINASGTVYAASDRRLKTEIKPLKDVWAKLDKIGGFTYVWKDPKSDSAGPQIGLIAQDLQVVYPELVKEIDNPDSKSTLKKILTVDYLHFVAVLLEGLKQFHASWATDSKQLHAEIQQLKSDMAKVKAENQALEARLRKLEK